MSTAVMSPVPFATTWEPVCQTWEPVCQTNDLPKENIQMRIARIVGKIFDIFSDMSLNEQAKMDSLKKEIKHLSKVHAEATGNQGGIAISAALIGFVITLISCKMPEPWQKVASNLGSQGSEALRLLWNSKEDQTIVLTSSQRDLLMKALDQAISDSQSKSQTRREFLETLKEILQTAQNASRGS